MTVKRVKSSIGHAYAMYVESKPDAESDGDPSSDLVYQAFVAHTNELAPVLFKTTRWYDTEAKAIEVMQAKIDALAPLRKGATGVSADDAVRDRILALAPTCHVSEIARRTGKTREHVCSVLAAAGVQAMRQPAGQLRKLGAERPSDVAKGGGRRASRVRIQIIRTLGEKGMSKAEIARQLGITRSAVVQLAARHLPDVKFRDARQTADVDKIKALAERGRTKAQIAKELGVTQSAVTLCAARRLPDVVFRRGWSSKASEAAELT